MPAPVPAIYQLKVTLQGIDPPIWRRFQVRSDETFYRLHLTLQVVMGWWNYHLHQFLVNGLTITDAETLMEWGEDGVSVHQARLERYLLAEGATCTYEYDFGDSWQHELLLEKILPLQPDLLLPRCLAGARACPPEDCGGSWGYADFLEAIGKPDHEEHQSTLEWAGGHFDPEAFDLDEVNRQLREGVTWQGELVLAPLASTQSFTRPAQWFWDAIPDHIQAQLLGNVWCRHCAAETVMVDFKGSIRQGDLLLRGHCLRCGRPVARIIEGE
ncbi:MAG: plasmid pRiA4b ORF-3 family protein [Chloroflexi bacterium]|nr:plasmid pRiA4b ORF-3 family protein [Chloroflexota bacterium]MCI0645578.1 plasmid pRiA4b ORF-3 family protein [Chloroflexota bacterium]